MSEHSCSSIACERSHRTAKADPVLTILTVRRVVDGTERDGRDDERARWPRRRRGVFDATVAAVSDCCSSVVSPAPDWDSRNETQRWSLSGCRRAEF